MASDSSAGEFEQGNSLSRVLAYEDALAVAQGQFLERGTLDMNELAEDLAVSRATLYRVVGNRDRLLGDVIWGFGRRTLRMAEEETPSELTGIDKIVEIPRRFNGYVVSFGPLRDFLRSEPLAAFRVLFTQTGRVHGRAVEAWREMLQRSADAEEMELPFEVDRLAYVIVRIGESMLYSDLIGGREPDIELAAMTRRAVLQARD